MKGRKAPKSKKKQQLLWKKFWESLSPEERALAYLLAHL